MTLFITLPSSSISLALNGQGRYVRVQLTSNSDPLSLAEVQIMGSAVNSNTNNTESGVQYYVNDHLNTPQKLVNENEVTTWEASYAAFGDAEITTELVVNNHRFPGQYYDAETGLYYNWNRYYDPDTGRYVSSDPIGLGGGMNTYGYVGGNPLYWIDPRGLQFATPIYDSSSATDRWVQGQNGGRQCLTPECAAFPDFDAGPYGGSCGSGPSASSIPDGPWKRACDAHDKCYETCGKTKAECDNEFYENGARLYSRLLTHTPKGREDSQEAYDEAQKNANCKDC